MDIFRQDTSQCVHDFRFRARESTGMLQDEIQGVFLHRQGGSEWVGSGAGFQLDKESLTTGTIGQADSPFPLQADQRLRCSSTVSPVWGDRGMEVIIKSSWSMAVEVAPLRCVPSGTLLDKQWETLRSLFLDSLRSLRCEKGAAAQDARRSGG